jgi:hypothetical protein
MSLELRSLLPYPNSEDALVLRNRRVEGSFGRHDLARGAMLFGGPKAEAAFDTLHHGLCDGDFRCTVGACALSIDDDPGLVVDEIV